MPFQYILHCVRCNDVTEIVEYALDSVVTPGGVLPRHEEYQIGDLLREARSNGSLPGIGPLLRDELPVPGEQRIGCHQRLQFIESPAPQQLGLLGQSHPLFVCEQKSLASELLLEDTVLLDEIIDDHLLLAVEPAGQGDYKEMERLYCIRHSTNRSSLILFDNNIIRLVRIFAPYGHGVWPKV